MLNNQLNDDKDKVTTEVVTQSSGNTNPPSVKNIKLISADSVEFIVPLNVASVSVTIKDMVEDMEEYINNSEMVEIPLPNVDSKYLKLVLDFCYNHVNDDPEKIEEYQVPRSKYSDWDDKFINQFKAEGVVEKERLGQIAIAANYLNVSKLMDLSLKCAASRINDISSKYKRKEALPLIEKYLGITDPFTEEERAKIEEENPWCREE